MCLSGKEQEEDNSFLLSARGDWKANDADGVERTGWQEESGQAY